MQVDNIFAFIRQVLVLFISSYIFVFIRQVAPFSACWLFKTSADLTFDLLTLKVVSESHVTWATSVSIFLVFLLGLSVLEVGLMYVTDKRQAA